MYKHVAFDMDGTLIDSIDSIMRSFQEAVKSVYGSYEKDEKILKECIGLPLSESFKFYPKKDWDRLQSAYVEANDEIQKFGVPFFVGVKEVLEELKNNGVKLHIVTSKRRKATLHWSKVMRVENLFSTIVAREDTVEHKPSAAPILKCIELVGCKREDIIYVGDSIHDVGSAKNAGVKIVICDWTSMDKVELRRSNPDYWISTPKELLNIVL